MLFVKSCDHILITVPNIKPINGYYTNLVIIIPYVDGDVPVTSLTVLFHVVV